MPEWFVLLTTWPAITAGYLVFGMVGFGTTLVAVPVIAHVVPLSTAVPAVAATDFLAATGNGIRMGAQVVKREVWRLLPPMFAGSAVGAWLLFAVPVRTLMLALGVFVCLYALQGLRPKAAARPVAPRWAWWYGLAGGVLSALFGAGGWVYSMYLVRRIEEPAQIRATQTAVLMFSSFLRVALFAAAGRYFDVALLWLVACLLPAMVLGLYLGHRVTLGMERSRFMRLLYCVLLVTGASLIARALLQSG
ncbi:sulfite exporter TauE/SafE family protein [Ramlibacter sp. Leaf400]|uniref:sulfite exporter TauE/SafE family protein n=1 Tax=Ramlibacter sp. Leaf400 TaxID=1736365 RepID=UPI0006F27346|nr:sulfite exporter TauE/SafE family protein [Ramlibacter sp. Leaf400]KQT13312.1 hypothetical protein ASG30_20355 [Ramlibacter sp. Leaf400]